MNEAIAHWRQQGRLFLWRYRNAPRMYAGWHFTADKAGCQSFLELIDLLLASDEPGLRTLTLDDPSPVNAHRLFRDHEPPSVEMAKKLRLRSAPDQTALAETNFAETLFEMKFGRDRLEALAASTRDIGMGEWDFSEQYGDARMSFWRLVR
ncbi:MAG: hypothetical protein IV086_00985 [Hyphomonadaceae bacterium]|nr:hypothetical protein [Hyphomonadaceae bacterium]